MLMAIAVALVAIAIVVFVRDIDQLVQAPADRGSRLCQGPVPAPWTGRALTWGNLRQPHPLAEFTQPRDGDPVRVGRRDRARLQRVGEQVAEAHGGRSAQKVRVTQREEDDA